MTSWSNRMTQTKHENVQIMETKDTYFCEESFIDRSFLILTILKPIVNRVTVLCHVLSCSSHHTHLFHSKCLF